MKFLLMRLTRLLPAGFRSRFGDEIEADIDEGLVRARAQGQALAFVCRTSCDLLKTALKEQGFEIWLALAVSLSIGLLLGRVDRTQAEVQGTLLVLIIYGILIGATFPRYSSVTSLPGLLTFVIAARIPLALPVWFLTLFFCALVKIGSRLARCLHGPNATGVVTVVAAGAGLLFGFSDFLVGTPWVVLPGVLFAGAAMGRQGSLKPAWLLGLCVPIAVVALMALGMHPARPHYVLIDLRTVPIALLGAWIGTHFPDVESSTLTGEPA